MIRSQSRSYRRASAGRGERIVGAALGVDCMDRCVSLTNAKVPSHAANALFADNYEVRADRDEAAVARLASRNWAGVWLVIRLKAV